MKCIAREGQNQLFEENISTRVIHFNIPSNGPILTTGTKFATDEGVKRACYVVKYMMASRYDSRNAYYKLYGRIAIIADSEQQTSLPEYHTLDSSYWDSRARGVGPTMGVPVTSVGDDNQRCAEQDRWAINEGCSRYRGVCGTCKLAITKICPVYLPIS